MSAPKSNQWLDAGDSDEELERGYDSEAHEEKRGGRSIKRRPIGKTEEESEEESEEEVINQNINEHDEGQFNENLKADVDDSQHDRKSGGGETRSDALGSEEDADNHVTFEGPTRTLKPLTSSFTTTTGAQLPRRKLKDEPQRDPRIPPPGAKTGVLYISKVPPYMKPSTLLSLLKPHAPRGLGRIFLTPENPETYKQRKRAGGNKKRSYTEGWVEFVSKRDAKAAAELLNARTIGDGIGGKKGVGRFYKDDHWNLVYLRSFKWSHLIEQIKNENAERTARMRAEISQATRENKNFTKAVELAKMAQTREEKRKRRREKERAGEDDVNDGDDGSDLPTAPKMPKMTFKQHAVRDKVAKNRGNAVSLEEKPASNIHQALQNIF